MWSKRRLTGALTNTAGRNGPSDRRFGRWSKALAGYAAALGRRRGRRGGLASRLGSGARRDFIIIMTMMMMMMTMMMMIMIIMIIMITAAVTIIRLAAAGGLGERRAPASTRAVSRFPPGAHHGEAAEGGADAVLLWAYRRSFLDALRTQRRRRWALRL